MDYFLRLLYIEMYLNQLSVRVLKKHEHFPQTPGEPSAGQHLFRLCQEDEKHSMVLLLTYAEPPGPFHRSHGKLLLKQTPLQLDAQNSFSLTAARHTAVILL